MRKVLDLRRKITAVTALLALCIMTVALPAFAETEGRHGGARGLTAPISSGATLNGNPLTGNFTVNRFMAQNGKLYALGTLTGTAGGQDYVLHGIMAETQLQSLSQAAALQGAPAGFQLAQLGACPILNLTIAPIHLNLLGLVVDIPNPIVVNIVAQSGPGNLLGNLLCSVANLLNGGLGNTLNQIVAALNQILAALGL